MTVHIIDYHPGRTLIDRQTFARLTGRSEETIRRRCSVSEYRDGKAMYDMEACEKILNGIAKRDRRSTRFAD